MSDTELAEDLERCADDGHPIVGNTLRCTCGHVDWTTPEVQVLSNAMCRHSWTGPWEEKAWEVLQDLAANGWQLVAVAGSATPTEKDCTCGRRGVNLELRGHKPDCSAQPGSAALTKEET
jgi:hypothetical protein